MRVCSPPPLCLASTCGIIPYVHVNPVVVVAVLPRRHHVPATPLNVQTCGRLAWTARFSSATFILCFVDKRTHVRMRTHMYTSVLSTSSGLWHHTGCLDAAFQAGILAAWRARVSVRLWPSERKVTAAPSASSLCSHFTLVSVIIRGSDW